MPVPMPMPEGQRKRRLLFALLSLLLAGCIRVPEDEARCQLYAPASLATTREEALQNAAFIEGTFPKAAWWEEFNDPQLTGLIERGLALNPSLKAMEWRVREACQDAKIQKSFLFPTIGFNGKFFWQYESKNNIVRFFAPVIPGRIDDFLIGFDLSYELDFWGKNRNLLASSMGEVRASQAEAAQIALSLATNISSAYFQWQALQMQRTLLVKQQSLIAKMIELAHLRLEHALFNQLQVLRIENQLFEVNENLLLVEQKAALTLHLLRALVVEKPDDAIALEPQPLSPIAPMPLPDELAADLVARRPDLMAQIWRVESLAYQVGAAKADFYPNVNLLGFLGLESIFLRKLFLAASREWSIGPAIHLPIFTAGRIRARYKKKKAEFEEAIHIYNNLLIQALKEVTDKIVVLASAEGRLQQQMGYVRSEEQLFALTEKRLEHALDNLEQVLAQQTILIRQQFDLVGLIFEQYQDQVELIKAFGGGYYTPCPLPFSQEKVLE